MIVEICQSGFLEWNIFPKCERSPFWTKATDNTNTYLCFGQLEGWYASHLFLTRNDRCLKESLTLRPRGLTKKTVFFLRAPISTCGTAHDSARHPPIPQHPQDFHLNSAGPVDLHIRLSLAHCSRNHSSGKLYYYFSSFLPNTTALQSATSGEF